MKSEHFLKEGFVEDASEVHADHEVQMARSDLFHAAEDALVLHKLLRNVSEQQGLEGWVAAKITLASDYLKTVREYIEYELMTAASEQPMLPIAEGSGSKEKQKTPYRDINSPEYRKAAEKQKEKIDKEKAAEPGKKLLGKIKKQEVEEAANDYFKRRKDEEDRIAGTKAPAKRTPQQTDYAKRRAQEKKTEQGVAEAAKWRDPKYKDRLYTQEPGDSDDYDNIGYGYDFPERPENDPGQKRRMGGVGSEFDRNDPLVKGQGIGRSGIKHSLNLAGKRKGLPSRDQITSLKGSIKDAHGKHRKPNLPEQGVAEAFGPLPRDNQQIRLGRHTVNIERVGEDNNYIGFAWHDSKGQDHYEEVSVGDLGSYDDLIDRIKQEISYQERQYTDQGVAEGEYKSRHIHRQEQNKKYDEYRRNQEAQGKKPLSRGDWAATQRKGQQGVAEGSSCNMTMEGKSCPTHGLKKCPGYKSNIEETTAGSVAGVVNPIPKNKAKVGTLFGGTYKQKKTK